MSASLAGSSLQILTLLSHMLTAGEASLFTNNAEVLQLSAAKQRVDLNIMDDAFLKTVLRDLGGAKSFLNLVADLRRLAAELADAGATMTISFQGTPVLTLGSKAQPTLSLLVTGAKAIQINNLRKLIQLGV